MSSEILTHYWALLIAGTLGTALVLFVGWRLRVESPQGQLAAARRQLQQRQRELARAEQVLRKSSRVLARLREHSASIRPSRLQTAEEAVEDARALAKIAHDQVLVAENQMLRVIVEEFPPRRHEALRRRYVRSDSERGRPYSG